MPSRVTGRGTSRRAGIGPKAGTATSPGALQSGAGAARVPRAAPNIAFAEYRPAGAAMCLSPRRRPVAPAPELPVVCGLRPLTTFALSHGDSPRALGCGLRPRARGLCFAGRPTVEACPVAVDYFPPLVLSPGETVLQDVVFARERADAEGYAKSALDVLGRRAAGPPAHRGPAPGRMACWSCLSGITRSPDMFPPISTSISLRTSGRRGSLWHVLARTRHRVNSQPMPPLAKWRRGLTLPSDNSNKRGAPRPRLRG